MKYARLSPEDEKLFLDVLDAIWQTVGYDCLVSVAEDKGIKRRRTEYGELYPAEQVTMSRKDVICIVTDNFAQSYDFQGAIRSKLTREQYDRIRNWMLHTPGHIVDKIVAKRFDCKRYGA